MAKPVTAAWSKLIVELGNGATPTEAFAAPCGLTSKGIAFSADTSDVTVPDCDDPLAATWVERVVRSLTGTVSGSGILALESLADWVDYKFSAQPKNVRVTITDSTYGGYFLGSYVCTALNFTGNIEDGKIRLDTVTLLSNGEITWTAT